VPESHKKKTAKTDDVNSDLLALEQKINDLTDALQRERADASNVRRRADEERLKMGSYFKASVIKELLPFIDNFDRALHHLPKDIPENKQLDEWLKGLSSIDKQLWQALESIGVQRIKTVGEHFDPKFHEAVQMDSSGEGTNEIITEEFMSGFSLEDEVLRHAMVKVANK
jgi:molecular chaperone GrpE